MGGLPGFDLLIGTSASTTPARRHRYRALRVCGLHGGPERTSYGGAPRAREYWTRREIAARAPKHNWLDCSIGVPHAQPRDVVRGFVDQGAGVYGTQHRKLPVNYLNPSKHTNQ